MRRGTCTRCEILAPFSALAATAGTAPPPPPGEYCSQAEACSHPLFSSISPLVQHPGDSPCERRDVSILSEYLAALYWAAMCGATHAPPLAPPAPPAAPFTLLLYPTALPPGRLAARWRLFSRLPFLSFAPVLTSRLTSLLLVSGPSLPWDMGISLLPMTASASL